MFMLSGGALGFKRLCAVTPTGHPLKYSSFMYRIVYDRPEKKRVIGIAVIVKGEEEDEKVMVVVDWWWYYDTEREKERGDRESRQPA